MPWGTLRHWLHDLSSELWDSTGDQSEHDARGRVARRNLRFDTSLTLTRPLFTNLYNKRPTWLKLEHKKLDQSVLAAYAATDPEGDWDEDWTDVWRDTGAGQPLPDGHALAVRRAEVDQLVLSNLLRLNQARAGKA